MNLYMAKQIVNDYNAILINESNDETFIKVRKVANEFMDMLCDNYPSNTDAIALVCNFGLVAMEQGDTLMLALLVQTCLIVWLQQRSLIRLQR